MSRVSKALLALLCGVAAACSSAHKTLDDEGRPPADNPAESDNPISSDDVDDQLPGAPGETADDATQAADEGTPATDDETPGNEAATPGDEDATSSNDDAGGDLGDDAPVPALIDGCDGQRLRAGIPEQLNQPGPWPVGVMTTEVDGLRTEVWYPAQPGSAGGAKRVQYTLDEHIPDSEAGKVPDENNPFQVCDCYRDLPLDAGAGPYPILVFVHGTAGFRTTNLENVAHWASRGFVVAAADHPGIMMRDLLGNPLGGLVTDQVGDARKVIQALKEPGGELAFLAGHIVLHVCRARWRCGEEPAAGSV